MKFCEACERGDHENCGMQTWCECECDGSGGWYVVPADQVVNEPRKLTDVEYGDTF